MGSACHVDSSALVDSGSLLQRPVPLQSGRCRKENLHWFQSHDAISTIPSNARSTFWICETRWALKASGRLSPSMLRSLTTTSQLWGHCRTPQPVARTPAVRSRSRNRCLVRRQALGDFNSHIGISNLHVFPSRALFQLAVEQGGVTDTAVAAVGWAVVVAAGALSFWQMIG